MFLIVDTKVMSKPFGATIGVAPIDNPLMNLMCELVQDATFPIHLFLVWTLVHRPQRVCGIALISRQQQLFPL